MTDKNSDDLERTVAAIKMVVFPLLLAFMIWYLNKMDNRFDKWEVDIQEMKINQRVIQRDITELKEDTTQLQRDVDTVKKNLFE